MKLAYLTPIFKKEDSLNKKTKIKKILPHLSKVFERIVQKQIDSFFTEKNYNAQYTLLKMIENWKNNWTMAKK